MPIDAIMFNPRLTGQARQLWTWLASLQYRRIDMSWNQCEYKMNCGTTARRRSLMLLKEEGFISISDDGRVVTMHDPAEVYTESRRLALEQICKECSEVNNQPQTQQEIPRSVIKPKSVKKPPQDEKKDILNAWNTCKPDSFAKIRSVSDKQKQAVLKHVKNLGLDKKDISEFICSVCRGLNCSEFWLTKVKAQTKNFNAVFGYGMPNDTKMRNIEQLYTDGDPLATHTQQEPVVVYTPEQQALIEEIEVHDYEIDTSFNDVERRERSIRFKKQAIEKLKALGVDLEQN